jgi:hypothetical protein
LPWGRWLVGTLFLALGKLCYTRMEFTTDLQGPTIMSGVQKVRIRIWILNSKKEELGCNAAYGKVSEEKHYCKERVGRT